MNGFWRTSIFTSGSGIRAPLKTVTHSVKIAFHKKNLMLPKQRKGPRLHRVKNVPKSEDGLEQVQDSPNRHRPRKTWHFYYQLSHRPRTHIKELKPHPNMIGSHKAAAWQGRPFTGWLCCPSSASPANGAAKMFGVLLGLELGLCLFGIVLEPAD